MKDGSKRIRIAVDLTQMLPEGANGGLKVGNLEFLRGLKNLSRFDFYFLSASATHAEACELLGKDDLIHCVYENRGFPIKALPSNLPNLGFRRFAWSQLRREGVGVVYCPFGVGRYFPRLYPVIVMVTDLLHRDFPGSITPLNRDWRERCFRHMEVLATKFQVISDFTASRLIELYRVSPDRIFRTYEAIQGRFSGPRSIRRRVFVYPANFWVHKNHEVLLSAYKLYVQNLEEKAWSLALTGAPDDRQRLLKRLANDLGLEGRVRFLGYLPERELFEVLASASCLVFPSLYEGFGIPLIEAMSLEVPILCSREGSIPEIVRDAALYVNGRNPGELAQAMAEMTLRPALRTSLIEAGKRRLRDFDFPREVETLAEALSGAALSNDEITPIQAARRFLWCLRWDLWYYSRSLATKVRLLLGALARIPKFLS